MQTVQTFANSRPGKGFGGKTCIFNSRTPELSEFQKPPIRFLNIFYTFCCPCSDVCGWSQVTFHFTSHVESWISEDIAGASENSQGLQPSRDAFCKTLQSADLHRCIQMFRDSQIQFSYLKMHFKFQSNTFLDVEIQWLRPFPLHPHGRFVLYFSLNQGIELQYLCKQEDTELNSCRIPNPVPQNENP